MEQNGPAPAFIIAMVVAVLAAALMFWGASWVYRDAKRRSFKHSVAITVCCCLNFPWPWLAYYLAVKSLDEAAGSGTAEPVAVPEA